MKVAISGYGVVGRAVETMLVSQTGKQPLVYDPNLGKICNLKEAKVCFVCVPAATTSGSDIVDLSAIKNTLKLLYRGSIVVIRSTILPGTTDKLQEENPDKNIYFVPEFLSEATSVQDELNPKRILIGVPKAGNPGRPLARLRGLLSRGKSSVPIFVMDASSAEMAKYAANSFYALKLTYFNELYDLCERVGVNWNQLRTAISMDPWTKSNHTNIWHGSYRGYGGKCLPKDVDALLEYARRFGSPLDLLEVANEINDRLRKLQ